MRKASLTVPVETPEEEAVPELVVPLEDTEVEEAQGFFNQIYPEDADTLKKASLEERTTIEGRHLTYGELDLPTVHQVLTLVRGHAEFYRDQGTLLDLGSGAGKLCIAAALLHPFERVVGFEVLQCLNATASEASTRYAELTHRRMPQMELLAGDFVADFDKVEPFASTLQVCIAVATCYGEAQLNAMASVAGLMPSNSIFVTFSQMLPRSIVNHPQPHLLLKPSKGGWILVHSSVLQMMWGPATCFIFKKVPPFGDEKVASEKSDSPEPTEPPDGATQES